MFLGKFAAASPKTALKPSRIRAAAAQKLTAACLRIGIVNQELEPDRAHAMIEGGYFVGSPQQVILQATENRAILTDTIHSNLLFSLLTPFAKWIENFYFHYY